MKFGLSWSVKGVRPDARRAAEEAARRAGLPLNDWLNAVMLEQAATQGIGISGAPHGAIAESLSGLHLRLDDLARRIDQVTRSGSAAYAPKRDRDETDRFGELLARLEQRIDQLADNFSRPIVPPPSPSRHAVLDRAIADIAARRYLLEGEPAPNLANLESQLRRVTDQLEALRHSGVEEEIAALRTELGQIGRALDQAVPGRAIEAIEKQIQDLTDHIAEGQETGVDRRALAGIEYGLAEVRDALCGLTSSDNLAGYTEAIDALAQKIDLIVAQQDPATIHQLDKLMERLRDIAAHVASNDTIGSLTVQVQALTDKIEHLELGGTAGDAFNRLELRIDALSRSVCENLHNGAAPADVDHLFQSLSEKIDDIRQSRVDRIALDHLENLVAKLVDRLDVADSRLGHLDAIERGLTDLLVHIEHVRASKQTAAVPADQDGQLSKQGDERVQAALEGLSLSLDRIADRLATIEKDIRGAPPKQALGGTGVLELTQIAGSSSSPVKGDVEASPRVALVREVQRPVAPSAPDYSQSPRTSLARVESPSLPADQPLEPGQGPRGFGTHPSVRIAASEAALGVTRPNLVNSGPKSSFIAAARRAAQAASQDAKNGSRSEIHRAGGGEKVSFRSEVARRGKGMLLAASIVAIVVGSIQLTNKIFDFGIFDSNDAKLAGNYEDTNGDKAVSNLENETTASIVANQPDASKSTEVDSAAALLAPSTLPSLTPARPTPKASGPADPLPLNFLETVETPSLALNPSLLTPPSSGPSAPKNDLTGSLARNPPENRPIRQSTPPPQPPSNDGLPPSIGAARLRNAASTGDPAAAYEVAMRYLEGRGVPANLEEAARWYERAANKGLVPAQFRYASMLEKGQGVKKDLVAAQKLYAAAASKGHAKAMHNLAVIYADGIDGKPDYAGAALWFRKAAEHGVADSQYNFGVLAARGLGIEKNLVEAYKWFALAAGQGDRDAGRKRDDVGASLDAHALAAAQEAIKAFVVQTQPAAATVVPEPPGGWDRTVSPPQQKPRAAGPLSVGAMNSGKL